MTVEANKIPPIHQRNDGIACVLVGLICWVTAMQTPLSSPSAMDTIADECGRRHAIVGEENDASVAGFSKRAESLSKYTVVARCVRKIEAGAIALISPSKHVFTASAFRASGTIEITSFAFKICRTDIEIACRGTSEISRNHPSPTCCRLHASSGSTTR